MNWKLLGLLAVFCILAQYGVMFVVYCFVAGLCFFLGLLFSMNNVTYPDIFPKRICEMSKGIPVVTAIMDCDGVPRPKIKMSLTPALDVVFNQIISYIIRDYINSWYAPLTTDTVFISELHRLLQQITANTVKRVSRANWIPFLTEALPNDLASHIHIYRAMIKRHAEFPDKDPIKLFFDIEVEAEKSVCRELICSSKEHEQEYLRRISEMFLFFVLPEEEYRVPAIRYIARELLVNAVLIPTIDLLSDPDFVNRSVAWFAKDSAYSSEYFIQALKMSDSAEELDVVVQQVNAFADKLRGRDTGGYNDSYIKSQLGSLEYLRKLCTQRLLQIKRGLEEKPENIIAYHLQPGMKLYDMSFQELMSTSVAVVSFLDFLTSSEKHSLLRLYINCVSYRENAQNLLGNEEIRDSPPSIPSTLLALADSDNLKSDGSFSFTTSDMDLDTSKDDVDDVEDVLVVQDESLESLDPTSDDTLSLSCEADSVLSEPASLEDNTEPPKTVEMREDMRAFGVLLCSNLLKQLPPSIEPLVQKALRALTADQGPPDPNAFRTIELKLTEMLSDVHCFGAFKRSPQYVQLLAELDLLKDPSELSSTTDSQLTDTSEFLPSCNEESATDVSSIPPTCLPTPSGSVGAGDKPTNQVVLPTSGFAITTPPDVFKANNTAESNAGLTDVKKSSDSHEALITSSTPLGTGLHAEIYAAHIVRTEIMRDSYAVYTLRVSCTQVVTGHTDSWQTLRRFRHFAEMHSIITDRCNNIAKLKLPSKRAFSNMSSQFLAKRRRELNDYLALLCSPEFMAKYPQARPVIVEFLQPDSWDRGRFQSRGVSNILNPFRTVSNAMKSMPDTLADGFSRMFTGLQPSLQGNLLGNEGVPRRSPSFDTGRLSLPNLDSSKTGYPSDPTTVDDSPIGMLFLLVDEMFGLQQKTHLSREGNFANEYTSPNRLAEFIAYLRDSVWPPTDPTHSTTRPGERDKETKLRTRVLCRTMLLGSVSVDLAQFLGNETTRRGVARLFRMLQEQRLNRRFVHFLLESILYILFRPHQAQFESIIEKQLCPINSGRSCHVHA
ncbi:Sorting nexin-13 [Paragonimus heterotremus]|uniref:Sorting nexin-13 n=1 Tax=Paragonimus heterotremus TaxID=100268 RepID=A0A8J4SMW6_9TREM|nr:Sorting nexin-13 [Paragonimus heterotremus]